MENLHFEVQSDGRQYVVEQCGIRILLWGGDSTPLDLSAAEAMALSEALRLAAGSLSPERQ